MKEKISITLDKAVIKNVDSLVDRLFIRNRSQAIEILLKNYLNKNKPAVILLGGAEEKLKIGEEFVPEVKIKGSPLIEKTICNLRKKNFKNIYIVARKKVLDRIFPLLHNGEKFGVRIKYMEEKESRGTAYSLRLIKREISTSFLVVFGDIIFDKINIDDLWNEHIKNSPIATLTLITSDNPSTKGQVFLQGNKIISFMQKPNKKNSYLVLCPIFVCEPEILQYVGASLEQDIFPALAKKQLLNGYVSSEREVHIHNKNDLLRLNKSK